jgi:hypothetical protein
MRFGRILRSKRTKNIIHSCAMLPTNSLVRILTEALRQKSTVTAVQFETLVLNKRVKRGELRVFEAAKSRKVNGVSVGSYYRVLDQARSRLERSIFTLLLAVRTQSLDKEELTRLLKMVAEAPEAMEEANMEEFMALLSALVKKMVVI